jgi:hypothetical protein
MDLKARTSSDDPDMSISEASLNQGALQMASQPRSEAPSGVTMVAFFAFIVGAVQLIAGIVMLIARDDVNGYTSGQALAVGISLLIVGGIYLIVGRGLLNLSSWALFVGLFFSGLKAVWDVIALFGFGIDGLGFGVLISLAINLIIFAALWSGRDAFAGGPTPARA